VATFTEAVAGEIVTLIFVAGSVQVEVEVVEELVEVEVVHVTAVLGALYPQEVRQKRATGKAKNRRRFTAPLLSLTEICNPYDSASTLIRKK
jgi:hypothetical protein